MDEPIPGVDYEELTPDDFEDAGPPEYWDER